MQNNRFSTKKLNLKCVRRQNGAIRWFRINREHERKEWKPVGQFYQKHGWNNSNNTPNTSTKRTSNRKWRSWKKQKRHIGKKKIYEKTFYKAKVQPQYRSCGQKEENAFFSTSYYRFYSTHSTSLDKHILWSFSWAKQKQKQRNTGITREKNEFEKDWYQRWNTRKNYGAKNCDMYR